MNNKRAYKPDSDYKHPVYHRSFSIPRGGKSYLVTEGTLVSVYRKPGLIAGKYAVLYGEQVNGVMLIHVEGPESRVVSERRRKIIREADIKQVHVKTRRRE